MRGYSRATKFPEVRDDLLKLAAGFARLADRVEVKARETITTDAAD